MEMEIIDWSCIESIFVEDDVYENLDAPKWFDFSATSYEEQPIDDDAWFCKPNCKHPKTAEDFKKSTSNSKVKFLRSVNISEMLLPFRDRTCRDAKKKENPESPKSAENLGEDMENKNPNMYASSAVTNQVSKEAMTKKQQVGDSHGNSPKAKLRSTFSARNLRGGGREILSQITELCSELKKLAKKGSKKGSTEKVLGDIKERIGEKERAPLLEVKK